MNTTRNLLQHNSQLRYILLSMSKYRTVAMLHTRICRRIDSSCIYTEKTSLKVQLPLTWSMCSYAKKAGLRGKKGKMPKQCKVEMTQEDIGGLINLEDLNNRMQRANERMQEDFKVKLALRTSLDAYARIAVETKDGKFNLNELGQVIQKTPQLYMIDLGAAPQYVKDVKMALDISGLNINPQIEGTTMFIPIPRVTREHRENLAKNAKLLDLKNEYQFEARELMEKKQKELLVE